MDDQDSGSSSGLVIGMIVGGVVLLVLVVLVVLGGAVFWTFEAGGPAPGGGPVAAPPIAVVEEAPAPPMGAPGPGGPGAVGPGGPAAEVPVEPRQHLIGIWEAKTKDGGLAIMDFRADGTLLMTDKVPGKPDMAQPVVRWDIQLKNDIYKLKIDTVKGEPNDHVVGFFGHDRMQIETMEGRMYERRKKAP